METKNEIIWWTVYESGDETPNELVVFTRHINSDGKHYSIWRTEITEAKENELYDKRNINEFIAAHETDGESYTGSWKEVKESGYISRYHMSYIADVMIMMDELECTADEAIVFVEQMIGCNPDSF